MARLCVRIGEAIQLALVCLAPWAFGAVTAWAELGLYLGVASVAILGAIAGRGADRARALACAPSLALIGLVLLATAQAAAWPGRLLGRVAPPAVAFRASLAPAAPARVLGDPGPPVAPPGPTLSQSPELTVDAAMRLAAGWALFQAVAGAGMGAGAFRRLGVALAVNGVLLTLFAVVQALSWNGRMYWVFPFEVTGPARGGPFINRNNLASCLNLGLGFALAALLVPGGRPSASEGLGRRLAAAYPAGLMVVGVLSSFSRGGFVAMSAATALLLLMARPRGLRIAGGLAAMLGLAVAFLWGVGALESYRRIATLAESGALDGRLECWKGAIRAWSTSPAWGTGLGTFAASAARFYDRDLPTAFLHAESDYVEVLAEGGAIGLALGLLLLGSLARLGLGALSASPDPGRRATILGGLFGLASLAIHGLSDFPMRIPAISVAAVVLAAHLARAGLGARAAGDAAPAGTPGRRVVSGLIALVPVIASLIAARHGWEMARSEAALAGAGIPPPGYEVPSTTLWIAPDRDLERARAHLQGSLRHRPDWSEGHARLGLILLSEYRAEVLGLVGDQAGDPGRVAAMADPLWLHGIVHSVAPERLAAAGGVLDQGPVRRHLVPAARSFLEARRSCPVWGLPHAELASLDYLIPGETASDHARRAIELAGNDIPTVAMAARAAAQAGDLRLAALGWRKILQVRESAGDDIADQARAVLTPQQILDWVLPDGRAALRFADRIYRAPEDRPARDRLLNWAADRLPRDLGLPEADRLQLEARAHARLGREGLARERMAAALALEPARAAWRRELVEWLLGWGRAEEAHDQALIGLHLSPDDPDARRAVERAAEALSRGAPPAGPGAIAAPK